MEDLDAIVVFINHHDPAVVCDGDISGGTDLPAIINFCPKPTDVCAGFAEDLDAVASRAVAVSVGARNHDVSVWGDGHGMWNVDQIIPMSQAGPKVVGQGTVGMEDLDAVGIVISSNFDVAVINYHDSSVRCDGGVDRI